MAYGSKIPVWDQVRVAIGLGLLAPYDVVQDAVYSGCTVLD